MKRPVKFLDGPFVGETNQVDLSRGDVLNAAFVLEGKPWELEWVTYNLLRWGSTTYGHIRPLRQLGQSMAIADEVATNRAAVERITDELVRRLLTHDVIPETMQYDVVLDPVFLSRKVRTRALAWA